MTEPIDDEQWAAGLRGRTMGAIPQVPVDVPGAVRAGRRRRAVRTGVVRGGILVAACGLAVAVVPAALHGLSSASDSMSSSADMAGAPAASADSAGAEAGGAYSGAARVTAAELVAGLRAGTLTQGTVVVVQEGVPDTGQLLASLGVVSAADASAPPVPVTPADWPRVTADCLADAGWHATLKDVGWEVDLAADRSSAFVTDLAACVEASPVR